MEISFFLPMIKNWLFFNAPKIFGVLLAAYIIIKVVNLGAAKALENIIKKEKGQEFAKRIETLSSVVHYLINVSILIVSGMIILKEIGLDIGPILAAAGVVGLAVGFGAQNLVQDVISGFFILLEDQIRVGDVVSIVGKSGLVEKVNLRMVVLRDLAGNVHFIRNGQIDIVTNMTKEYSRYVFNIGVAYRENVDHVIEVIKQLDEEMRSEPEHKDDILEPIEILGLDEFADSAVIIKARYKTKPIKQWAIGREFNRRLKKKFDELDIEIPFPHVTLYMGQVKQGESPPINIELRDRAQKGIENERK